MKWLVLTEVLVVVYGVTMYVARHSKPEHSTAWGIAVSCGLLTLGLAFAPQIVDFNRAIFG